MDGFSLRMTAKTILVISILLVGSPSHADYRYKCDVGKPSSGRVYSPGERVNGIRGWIIRVKDPEKVQAFSTLANFISTGGLTRIPEAVYQSDKRDNGLWDRNQGVFATRNSQGSLISVVLNRNISGANSEIRCFDYTRDLITYYEIHLIVDDISSESRLPAIGIVKEVRRLNYRDKYGAY